jgi:hypothetical protein
MATNELKALVEKARKAGYPYPDDLLTGCEFYPDEGYFDGEDLSAEEEDDRHPNASGCDCCHKPAQYMTFPANEGGRDTEALYICEECIPKYHLEPFVEGMRALTPEEVDNIMENPLTDENLCIIRQALERLNNPY